MIQTLTTSQDSTGQPVETWSDTIEQWASIEPLSGREFWTAREQSADTTARIRFRYSQHTKNLSPASNRLKYGTRVYELESVINTGERDKEVVCMCREEYQ